MLDNAAVTEQRTNLNAGIFVLAWSGQSWLIHESPWFSRIAAASAVWSLFFAWRQWHWRKKFHCHAVRNASQIWYTAVSEGNHVTVLPLMACCLLYFGYRFDGYHGIAVASVASLAAMALTLIAERYPLSRYA